MRNDTIKRGAPWCDALLKRAGWHSKWGAGPLWERRPAPGTAVVTLSLSGAPTWRLSAGTRARAQDTYVMDWVGESHHLVVHARAERGGPRVINDICLESSKAGFKYFGFKVTFVSIVHSERGISQIQPCLGRRRRSNPGARCVTVRLSHSHFDKLFMQFFARFVWLSTNLSHNWVYHPAKPFISQ